MGAPPRYRRRLEVAALVLLCLVVAVVVCLPVSLHPGMLVLDQASPGHMTFAASMQRWGPLSPNRMIGFPEGAGLSPLAVPVQSLALLLGLVVTPVEAWNLSVVALVALQGLALLALGAAWGWTLGQRIIAVIAMETCPLLVAYIGNGQVEQIGFAWLALITWALWQPGRARLLLAGLGLTLAVLSSPYQALIAGLLVVVLAARHGPRWWLAAVGVALVCAQGARLFFGGEIENLPNADVALYQDANPESGGEEAHLSAASPTAAMCGLAKAREPDPAGLVDLVLPRVEGVLGHRASDLLGPRLRIRVALSAPRHSSLPQATPTELPFSPTYLGALSLLAGGLGLWRARGSGGHRGLALWAIACLVAALGTHLSVFSGRPTVVALPWTAAAGLPTLGHATSTVRFLGGMGFACVLGMACLAGTWRTWQATAFSALLAATNLLFAPVYWPRPGVVIPVDELAALLPPGPVAAWPGVGEVLAEDPLLLAAALDRPVALFHGERKMRESARKLAADKWLAEAREAGVRSLLERVPTAWPRSPGTTTPPPLPPEAIMVGEAQGYRVWVLDGDAPGGG